MKRFWSREDQRWWYEDLCACGDKGERRWKGQARCQECFDELSKGVIRVESVHFLGGSSATKDPESPWGENAVRALEDGR